LISITKFDIHILAHHCLVSIDQILYCSSNLLENGLRKFEFNSLIQQITATEKHCLILLESGEIHKLDFDTGELTKLEFLQNNRIQLIDSGIAFTSCVTTSNSLYNIPVQIHKFEKRQKIKKLRVGNENGILLTANGDVFTWGCGLRGQLGHGEISTEIQPKLVEALSGIKIVDIDTSGFHSHAISSFGDLYSFGWNTCGELGIKQHSQSLAEFKQHNQSVFATPQLIDSFDKESIIKVYCGIKHTLVRSESGKLFGCGSNKYFQLGEVSSKTIDNFVEINCAVLKLDSIVKACDFGTLILNYRE
jgi:alpha-tubulin suppressor-like RCC1 family protein